MLIALENVTKVFRLDGEEVHALRGVSLEIREGEFVAIIGPSGSGKSTMMNILGLLDRPTSGRFLFEGRDVATMDDAELARLRNRRIGFVFQSFNLLPRTPAIENVELPMVYSGERDRRRRSAEALAAVGLEKRAFHQPSQLSGGEQQRVAIARALVMRPSIILADEPTGNLDTKRSAEIMRIFERLNLDGITVVLITHELEIAAYAKRIVRFRDGLIESDELHRRTTAGVPVGGPP
jgi:putative ABC transport system ATP-binding protein